MKKENLYVLQVKNLRKYNHLEWITLHTLVDLNKFKDVEMALKITLSGFSLRKERDNLPMEYRFVKVKVGVDINVLYMRGSKK